MQKFTRMTVDGKVTGYKPTEDCLYRLWEYESTGVSPDQIERTKALIDCIEDVYNRVECYHTLSIMLTTCYLCHSEDSIQNEVVQKALAGHGNARTFVSGYKELSALVMLLQLSLEETQRILTDATDQYYGNHWVLE